MNTPSATVPARPAAVSRVLAKAGFDRAEAETTSVPGHYRYSPGFKVMSAKNAWEIGLAAAPDGLEVIVTHETLDSYHHDRHDSRPSAEIEADMTARYADALREAGYEAQVVKARGGTVIKVTGRLVR